MPGAGKAAHLDFHNAVAVQGSWNVKHLQRMEEVEAEEEAAQHEDLIDEYTTVAPASLTTKRPVRAIKLPRHTADKDLTGLRARETDLDAVSPSPQRGGRGIPAPSSPLSPLPRTLQPSTQ